MEAVHQLANLPQPDMNLLFTGLDELRKLPNIPALQGSALIQQSLNAILDRLTHMDQQFTQINQRFDQVDGRLARIEDRLGTIEDRLGTVEVQSLTS
jgi:hypothetical protein